jgi:hypothetical protein
MGIPILQTKLYIPPRRPGLVPRPHLIERLNEGLSRKLTLISAPAGFGKTTLVSYWLQQLAGEQESRGTGIWAGERRSGGAEGKLEKVSPAPLHPHSSALFAPAPLLRSPGSLLMNLITTRSASCFIASLRSNRLILKSG